MGRGEAKVNGQQVEGLALMLDVSSSPTHCHACPCTHHIQLGKLLLGEDLVGAAVLTRAKTLRHEGSGGGITVSASLSMAVDMVLTRAETLEQQIQRGGGRISPSVPAAVAADAGPG